jgi:hypothetical protein
LDLIPREFYNFRNDLVDMEKKENRENKQKRISSEEEGEIQWYIELGYSRKAASDMVREKTIREKKLQSKYQDP